MAAPEGGRQDASGHWGDRLPPHQVHCEALSAALRQQSVLFVPLGMHATSIKLFVYCVNTIRYVWHGFL